MELQCTLPVGSDGQGEHKSLIKDRNPLVSVTNIGSTIAQHQPDSVLPNDMLQYREKLYQLCGVCLTR
jgi:hypothetical protein